MDSTHTQDSKRSDGDRQGKIYWHEAFFKALQLELHDYIDVLTFVSEHQLSKEALIMDALIIKKEAGAHIGKNIGEVFRGHNIFEFKSETDSLSVWDYSKVLGYAMIYSAFERVPLIDITVSFVVTPKPAAVFKELAKTRGLTVDEAHRGIYYVSGEAFPVQIIEGKRLAAKENVFLKHLRSGLTTKDMRDVIGAYRKYGLPEKVDAYLNRLINANTAVAKEVMNMGEMMSEELVEVATRYMVKTGQMQRIAANMIKKGYALEEVAENIEMPLEWVQELAKETLVTV
jgi:hypothetical protein